MPIAPAPLRAGRRGDLDRCPGALRLHEAADGWLARVRLAGRALSRHQLTGIADCAADVGNGVVELTSRGNLQLRGLGSGDGEVVAGRLQALGLLPSLAHDRARNIVLAPFATAGTEQLAVALDEAICAAPRLVELSGRFLFAVRGPQEGRRTPAVVPSSGSLSSPARGDLGDVVPDLVVTSRGDVDAAVGLAETFLEVAATASPRPWQVSELDAASRARWEAAGPAARLAAPGYDAPPAHPTWRRPGRVVVDGELFVQALAPLGEASAGALLALADVVGAAGARVTPWRTVVLPGLSDDAAASALIALASAGWVTEPDAPLVGHTACTGRPGCSRARSDVRADAGLAAVSLGRPGLPVHWSGCDRRCGHPAGDFVDLVAIDESTYDGPDGRPLLVSRAISRATGTR